MLNWYEEFINKVYASEYRRGKMGEPMMEIGNTLLPLWVKPLNNDSIKRY